ncbi:MAG TPA: FAD-binding protein [Candidatus Dormibacteraeota bacterium]|nr:FAD-binding protein [Candidatus Dormibacteraeota bacterium]
MDCGIAIVGSGVAGLMAAIAAADAPETVLFTDGPLGKSNSSMAQGGLQLPPPGADALERFGADMRRSARVPLDAARVAAFVAHVEETIACLVDWGLELDRDAQGEVVRRMAGGLSEPRIVSSRDQIGPAIMKILLNRVRAARVHVVDHARVVDVRPAARGVVLEVERAGGAVEQWRARAAVCCTGGVTFREAQRRALPTTNPANENHVLFDRLAAAGLPLEHADFFQFQPYGLAESGHEAVGRCVPESIVNFRVRLLDRYGAEIGAVGQDRYALTQRMFAGAEEGRAVRLDDGSPGFWLTLSDVDPDALRRHFPKLVQYLERHDKLGADVLVFPFLHYFLGGFRVNVRCESPWPGLFLAGEMVGGLHGRNRLMGNGITDSLVHGRLAGRTAREYVA